jgi:hypothetical protein
MNNSIDIEIYEILKNRFTDREASVLIQYFNQLNAQKMDHSKDLFATKGDVANAKSDLIKWMFVFWIGQMAGSVALFKVFL